jgi:hypothetical protein
VPGSLRGEAPGRVGAARVPGSGRREGAPPQPFVPGRQAGRPACSGPLGGLFATDPTGVAPPHPDGLSHAFVRVRQRAGVAADVHLHSLRHFQSTVLDSVITEAQKQARLGWSTVQMARHYTGALTVEDRRAAEHIGGLLGGPKGRRADAPSAARTSAGVRRPRQGR